MARPRKSTSGKGPRGSNAQGSRSGQGSSSALAEMLRRQAQNPRPGAGQQQPPREGDGARPVAPRRPPGQH